MRRFTGRRQCHTNTNKAPGDKKVIGYASRTFSDAETRYGQIEREALAIHFACLKFQIYLLGQKFTIFTDHKPLVYMFNKPRSQMPYRIERIRMKLQGFDFNVVHIPGVKNPTDFLSRKPIKPDYRELQEYEELEKHVHLVINEGNSDAVKVDEIRESTKNDRIMHMLSESISKGIIDTDHIPELIGYKSFFNELSIIDGVITKKDKIVIPMNLRKRIIAAGHDGHQGIVKTKMLLRSKAWYPGMDKDINEYVSNCRGCQVSVNDNSREPLIMTELPKSPWESVATDFYGPLPSGEYFISVIDDYSRFPVVKIVRSTSPKSSVPVYDEIFSEFGIPNIVRGDNGSPVNSKEFRDFAAFLGFEHKL